MKSSWRVIAALALQASTPALAGDQAAQVFAQVSGSVCTVLATSAGGAVMQGSAVVIGPGKLVTNNHVVADTTSVTVRNGANQFAAVVESTDPAHDLALLRADALSAP